MTIMHVTKKYPPALGGDAVVVQNLERQQRAAGHNVVIVTSNCKVVTRTKGVYKVGLQDTPEQLDTITLRRIVSLLMLAVKMFFIIRRERPQVIHTHSIDMAFFVSFAARWFKVPLVHTFHIVTFYDAAQSPLRRKTELWFAKKAGLSAATAPNSFDVRKLQHGGLHHATLLPNGVDPTFWQGHTPRVRTANEPFTFVTVGRLEKQKGYEFLIKAAAELARTTAESFNVVIIGEGSLKAELGALVRELRLTHVVKLVGRKDADEIRELFARADAAVCTSLYETTPLTLLEAWAAGLPVITTPVGIVREVPPTFRSAYVVSPQNDLALASIMRQCMADEAMRTLIAQSGKSEVQQYTWPTVAQTAESVYRSAL